MRTHDGHGPPHPASESFTRRRGDGRLPAPDIAPAWLWRIDPGLRLRKLLLTAGASRLSARAAIVSWRQGVRATASPGAAAEMLLRVYAPLLSRPRTPAAVTMATLLREIAGPRRTARDFATGSLPARSGRPPAAVVRFRPWRRPSRRQAI